MNKKTRAREIEEWLCVVPTVLVGLGYASSILLWGNRLFTIGLAVGYGSLFLGYSIAMFGAYKYLRTRPMDELGMITVLWYAISILLYGWGSVEWPWMARPILKAAFFILALGWPLILIVSSTWLKNRAYKLFKERELEGLREFLQSR